MKFKSIIHILLLVIISITNMFGQAKDSVVENLKNLPTTGKGILYQDGKIYLVVLVLLTIFAAIIFYLIRLEKKIKALE